MEDNSAASGGGKSTGVRSKTPAFPTSTRLQRNLAEKERRDKLNGFISELATLVPMVSNASKPLDKVSILRLAAAEMRLHFSCLNPKKYKSKPLTLPPAIVSSLDLIEKTIGGFIIATTLTGLIVFCSRSIEDYLGYQNIDVMGNKVVKYIYEDDIKYFESKVNSVVNSLKKGSKKKTKVIKAHMLQKPLPRSNETSRPRRMIFKISMHQNDTSESNTNGKSSHASNVLKKIRPPKDFGYSAVVLMFIEPVLMEPEIDITYIDSNQDVYFTRHGLQGEIIYADQRISSITGYMPHDVQGTSAYQYICSSDVPIALFAQKAMFTSNDGKGVIVYRLRIRDMRFIYLQSSGQIAYNESSNEISHFVCFNRLLSEEEGSQELKRFQQRYAPQIMEAKMLQMKRSKATGQPPNTDHVLDQAFALINSSGMVDAAAMAASLRSPFLCPTDSSVSPGSSDKKAKSNDGIVSPASTITNPSSIHSSEGHSIVSPMSIGRSSSVGSDYSEVENLEKTTVKTEHLHINVKSFHARKKTRNESSYFQESHKSKSVNQEINCQLLPGKSHYPESKINGSALVNQSNLITLAQNKIMHSVNAYNNLQCNIGTEGFSENLNEHPMDLNFDDSVLQNNSTLTLNTVPPNCPDDQIDVAMPGVNFQSEYVKYNGQVSYIQPAEDNYHFYNSQINLQQSSTRSAAPSTFPDQYATHSEARSTFSDMSATHSVGPGMFPEQRLNFAGEQVSRNRLSHPNDLSSFGEMIDISSVSSLSKDMFPAVSDRISAVGCSPNTSSYHESDRNAGYLPSTVTNYNNGATNGIVNNGLDILISKKHENNLFEANGFHVSNLSGDILTSFPSVDRFDAVNTSAEMAAINQVSDILEKQMDYVDISPTAIGVVDKPTATYHNGSSGMFCNDPHVITVGGNGANIHSEMVGNIDLAMNKELYRELDLFFQNLPESNSEVSVPEAASEFPVASSSYAENSISFYRAKTNYHH